LEVQYSLDGRTLEYYTGEDLPKIYSVALTGLSDGKHSIKIWMKALSFEK